ncbi:MAG: cytochrome c [Pseudomonadota bacterium]|nr:cytochrome c [Pseudomonadota bacterium]
MKKMLVSTLLGMSLMSASTWAHIEQSEPLQSLRQSYFALLGMTFSPMGDMVKGKIEWNDALFTEWANDLNHAAQFGVERGFAPGSEKGTTRAKADIWSNMDDFQSKLDDFRAAAATLAETAAGGDQAASRDQFIATGGTCKACHDEYKSKNYLY